MIATEQTKLSFHTMARHYAKWSKAEIHRLKNLYPSFPVKKLADQFPQRNKATIIAKARSLNLPSAKLWQVEENNILQEHFQDSSIDTVKSLLPKRSWTAIMMQAERLGLKRNRAKPRLEVDESYFKTWSPSMAYLLGFILSDGCIIRGAYTGYSDSLKFGVQLSDIDILEKIKYELESEHSISIVKNAAYFSITSQKIVDDLKLLGISYKKSLRENVPNIPPELVRDFIRGFVDGDGGLWIDKKNYPTLCIAGGEDILSFIREHFFEKFALHSKLVQHSYSPEIKCYLYQIAYRCNSAQILIDYLYRDAVLSLDRKYIMAMHCLNCKIKKRNNSNYRLKKYNGTYTR